MREGLPNNHGLDARILRIPALLPSANGQALLTDVQFEALALGVARGESAIISAPTSTGKTLIGLWTIASAVLSNNQAVYLVSHRALARQKFDELRTVLVGPLLEHAGSLVLATGDGVEDALGRRVANPLESGVLVATYEKFLSALSVNGPPRDLSHVCFVCDEIQLISDEHRGSHAELLLTLLKRGRWKQFVGLSAVLSERDAQELANWLGVRIVRNPKREKSLALECRAPHGVVRTSADPDRGVRPLERHRPTAILETIRIVRELTADAERNPVIVFCMRIDDTYSLTATWVRERAVPRQEVPRPAGAEVSDDLLNALAHRSAYHNAELTEDERALVEQRLQQGEVDVVFATTTLAAGVNFPLGSAVFHSWKRFNFARRVREPISRSEFLNMAGRVGRMGQVAAEGLVVLTAEDERDQVSAVGLMDFEQQDELVSRIGPQDFGPLLLHIFAGGLCDSRASAYEILSNTLSAERELHRNRARLTEWEDRINAEIDNLVHEECLIEGRSIVPTLFGVSVARTGLKPATANWFISELYARSEYLHSLLPTVEAPGDEDAFAFILTQAALTSPEFTVTGGRPSRYLQWKLDQGLAPNQRGRDLSGHLFSQPWTAHVAAANGALLVTSWATGQRREEIEKLVRGVRLGVVQATARDVAWVLTGISEIILRITAPGHDEAVLPVGLQGNREALLQLRQLSRPIKRHAIRLGLGLPADVLWMTGLEQDGPRPRLSRPEILSLRHNGLVRPLDLMRGDEDADNARRAALLGVGVMDGGASTRLRSAARHWKVAERQQCRRLHERRTNAIDGGDLVRRLYDRRGAQLEPALEEAFGRMQIRWTKLDDGRVPGIRPVTAALRG